MDSLKNKLEHTHLFKFVKKLPVPVLTYDPSDYMWYLTTLDPDSWLWHLKKIHADQAWDITKGDSSVSIAVIDTWFDINHPDLSQKIKPHYDPYDNVYFDSDCYKSNHGTTVASFAAAQTDGGGQLASVGFNSRIIAYSFNNGLVKALHASTVMGADVISISWYSSCSPGPSRVTDSLMIEEILNNGTTIVASAGNGWNGPHCARNDSLTYLYPFSPAYDSRIIIVTSTDRNDNHTFFENGVNHTHSHFPEVDICAPGYNVMGATCTLKKDSATGNCVNNSWPYYGSFQGTSFATPIVAGVCALMKTVNPSLTPWAIQDIIKLTADPVNDAYLYPGLVGAGRINAYKAVKVANCDFSNLPSPYIQGSNLVCDSYNSIFTLVNRTPGSTVEWLHSNNTIQIGAQNNKNYIIKSASNSIPDSGWVKVVIHTAGCGNDTIKKMFWVNKVPGQPITDPPGYPTYQMTLGQIKTIRVVSAQGNPYEFVWNITGSITKLSGGGTQCTVEATTTGWGNFYVNSINECGTSVTGGGSVNVSSGGGGGLLLSPNPADNILSVKINNNKTPDNLNSSDFKSSELRIYDKMMDLIMKKTFRGTRTQINVRNLKQGVYILQIISGNKNYKKEIMVSHH